MLKHCDLALTVEERAADQFFWLVLVAVHEDLNEGLQEELLYRRLEVASQPQRSYANALVLGADALRRLRAAGTG